MSSIVHFPGMPERENRQALAKLDQQKVLLEELHDELVTLQDMLLQLRGVGSAMLQESRAVGKATRASEDVKSASAS